MGSFNHKGNFSNLPISYGDRIVILLGFSFTSDDEDLDGFAPGNSFVPISLPIKGSYDDYGGIENVDKTPGVEKLEEVLGSSTEEIVCWAERISSGCSHQLGFSISEKFELIFKNSPNLANRDHKRFSYIMEHEEVFNKLVEIGNPMFKDTEFWRIPHIILEDLGYKKTILGKDGGYDVIEWKHDSLPELKENCYVWLKDEFGNYGKTSHTISSLCSKIGCSVPEKYNQSYFGICFDKSIKLKEMDRYEILMSKDYNSDDYSYLSSNSCRGLFNLSEYRETMGLCSIFDVNNNEHLDKKYKKEFIELSSLYSTLGILGLTWGNTNYYQQGISFDNIISFQECVLSLIKKKKAIDEDD